MKMLARIGAAVSAVALGAGVLMVPSSAGAAEITATGTSLEKARSLYHIIAANDAQAGQDVSAAGCQKAESLDDTTKQALLKSINAARELAGVKAVELLDAVQYKQVWEDFQQGAVATAEANKLSHGLADDNPCLPAYPAARDTTAFGNLAIGWSSGNAQVRPITQWTKDMNTPSFGHRITTLDPTLTKYAFGIAHNYSSDLGTSKNAAAVGLTTYGSFGYSTSSSPAFYEPLKDFPQQDRSSELPKILAWPAPGYFPAELATDSRGEVGWTLEVPRAAVASSLTGAKVEILENGAVIETLAAQDLDSQGGVPGGMAGISFYPTKVVMPTDGTVKAYTVRVTSADGGTTWTYPVNLFEATKETVTPEVPAPTTTTTQAPQPTTTTPEAPQPTTTTPAAPKPTTTTPAAPKPTTTTPEAPKLTTTTPEAPKPTTTTPAAPKPTTTTPEAPKPTTTTPEAPKPTTTTPAAPTPGTETSTASSVAPLLNTQFYNDAGLTVTGDGTKDAPFVIPTKDKASVTLSVTLDPAAKATVEWSYAESVDATDWTALPDTQDSSSLLSKMVGAIDRAINSALSLVSEPTAGAAEEMTGAREVHRKVVDYIEGRVYRAHASNGTDSADVYFVVTNTDSDTPVISSTEQPNGSTVPTEQPGMTTSETPAGEPGSTSSSSAAVIEPTVTTTTPAVAAGNGKGTELASTGSAGQQIALTAGALLLGGVVLFLVARRRKLSE